MSPELQGKNLSVKVSIETLEILDKIAHRCDISRSKLIHNLIETTIDEMDMGRRIGFFQMIILIRNFHNKVTNFSARERKKETPEEKTVPVRLSHDYQQKLAALAKIADRSPHYLMKNFIQVGAEEMNSTIVKTVMPLALVVRDLKEKIDSLCVQGEEAMKSYMSGGK